MLDTNTASSSWAHRKSILSSLPCIWEGQCNSVLAYGMWVEVMDATSKAGYRISCEILCVFSAPYMELEEKDSAIQEPHDGKSLDP